MYPNKLFNDFVMFLGTIMYFVIISPDNIKNVVGGLNKTDKQYLKLKMELVGNLKTNDT